MRIAAVIPARYGSTRFPGKPLADVAGRSLIRRVHEIAAAAEGVSEVLVATDDRRIADHVESFGGTAVMTPPECRNGTERVHAAIQSLDERPDGVINLQGDAVLTPPWVLKAVAAEMRAHPELPMVTPAARLDARSLELLMEAKAAGEVGGTTVVFNRAGDALYFSKAVIPYVRDPKGGAPTFRHIGLYGYRTEALDELIALPPSALELTEGLEQLRALDNGMRIRVVEVDYRGRRHLAIDSPEDLVRVEGVIAEDGELVPR
ncbi:3-deoxy-manno-octulosonate cytidylyltransferase [Planctomycetes bacterium Poly30]|uniref:3-deoxy-manno-octulosonate cytidylyltransferase n=1 Tax=Saltatorellus ferox TaxID=2528018 RepID=A0A518EXG7_9BACT|nr:3-deoxy-manno-octulosonate cytidylyltransferase [Planctomycetes bacterium Poly30]